MARRGGNGEWNGGSRLGYLCSSSEPSGVGIFSGHIMVDGWARMGRSFPCFPCQVMILGYIGIVGTLEKIDNTGPGLAVFQFHSHLRSARIMVSRQSSYLPSPRPNVPGPDVLDPVWTVLPSMLPGSGKQPFAAAVLLSLRLSCNAAKS